MWEPKKITENPDEETVIVAEDDCIQVCLVNIGEGTCGDYNPDNPDDVNLLRFDVNYYDKDANDWMEVEDASYCTNVEADSTPEHLKEVVCALFNRYRDEYTNIASGGSVKKMGEELSWIS